MNLANKIQMECSSLDINLCTNINCLKLNKDQEGLPNNNSLLLCNSVMVQYGSGSLRYTCNHGNTAHHLVTAALCMWVTSSGWGRSLVAGASWGRSMWVEVSRSWKPQRGATIWGETPIHCPRLLSVWLLFGESSSRDESWTTLLSSVSTLSWVPSLESGRQRNWKQKRRNKHQHTYLKPPPTLLGVSVKYLVSLLSHICTA